MIPSVSLALVGAIYGGRKGFRSFAAVLVADSAAIAEDYPSVLPVDVDEIVIPVAEEVAMMEH